VAPATVYLETTVLSYLTTRDARDGIIAAHQSVTRTWWESQRQQYRLVASAIVVREASAGDPEMAAKRLALIADCDLLQITDAVDTLAALLLARGLVPATVPNDALHIAVATVGGAEYLLTWNLRHLAGAIARRRIEQELRRLGHESPTICTPEELMP
jgi:predicted nucleic acid-binding protein